jgi:SAM-dependent methyltransferase
MYVDGSYADSNPGWHEGDSRWKADRILEMMVKHGLNVGSVCEIGCGAGEILVCLQSHLPAGIRFVGYEPSPQAFMIAAAKSGPCLAFQQSAAPEKGTRFDLVLVIDVIEHIPDYLGALQGFKEMGRHFILHIPLDLSVLSVLREWPLMKRRRCVGHLHYFTKETALATVTDSGYKILDACYTEIQRPEERNLKTILLRRIPLWLLSHLGLRETAVRIFGEHSLLILATTA